MTPQAPGSATFSLFSDSLATYALLPALASTSFVSSAALDAALTASAKLFPEMKLSTKALRGSIRVLEGLRARVYVYNPLSAESRAPLQSIASVEEECSP